MKGLSLLIAVVILTLVTAGCVGMENAQPLSEAQSQPNSVVDEDIKTQVYQQELDMWNALSGQIEVSDLTDNQKFQIETLLNGGDATVGLGKISASADNVVSASWDNTAEPPAIIVAALSTAASNWQSWYSPIIESNAVSKAYVFEQVMHCFNHMSCPYDIAANGAWFQKVISAALNGQGSIYQFEAPGGMRYMFVSNVGVTGGKSAAWAVVLADNGAPVTGYDPSLKDGVSSLNQLTRWTKSMLKRGYTVIDPKDLPSDIKNNWTTSRPPVLRFWWWGIKYQVELGARMAGIAVTDVAKALYAFSSTTLVTPGIIFLVVPDCRPEKTGETVNFVCRQEIET